MEKLKISAVSYTNTQPFIYGIEHSPEVLNQIDLSLDIPADCAQKLIDGVVDIGLIPVAATLNMPYWEIVSDYCIGAEGPVNSVFIFSNCPIEQVQTLQLDPESRSSNNLARVLLKNYWKLTPALVSNAPDYANSINSKTAFVQIGDRTFGKTSNYPYVYDLAGEWKNFTGLPFMFAAWIANKPISPNFISIFNKALKLGIDNRDKVIAVQPHIDGFDAGDYLLNKLDFSVTNLKRVAMATFLEYIQKL